MNISQRLRTCARHTGLDAVIELLQEAADEIDALQARAQVQGEPVTVAVDHFDNGPFEAYTNRIHPPVEIGTKLYTTPQPAQATQAEAQQPATTEPVAWPLMARVWKRESTQEWVLEIEGTLGDTDMNIRHTQPLSVAYENVPGLPTIYTHPAPSVPADVALDCYDAGILNDFGGGNVEWWQDYIRAELGHAHDFYQSQIATPQPAQATQAEVTDEQILATGREWSKEKGWWDFEVNDFLGCARAILALRPEKVPMTDGIKPEDFTVDVVVKPMGGFAPVNTQGVRVTHKPTGISVTCNAARSQHTNRHQAFEKLSAILAQRPQAVPMTHKQAIEMNDAVFDKYMTQDARAIELVRSVEAHHGITAQAKKEAP